MVQSSPSKLETGKQLYTALEGVLVGSFDPTSTQPLTLSKQAMGHLKGCMPSIISRRQHSPHTAVHTPVSTDYRLVCKSMWETGWVITLPALVIRDSR